LQPQTGSIACRGLCHRLRRLAGSDPRALGPAAPPRASENGQRTSSRTI
jgi:hypothetical protein